MRAELGIDHSTLTGLEASFNVCPGQGVVAAIEHAGERRLGWLIWGLEPRSRQGPTLINARAETIRNRPAFRDAFRYRRCLIAADGFYEWKREAGGKTPWLIHPRSGKPLTFAGIWEPGPREDKPRHCCAIVTCAPNELMAPIHDRMPAILEGKARDRWLDASCVDDELASLLGPLPEGILEAFPVSTRVNSPRNDSPDLIEPVGCPFIQSGPTSSGGCQIRVPSGSGEDC